MKQIVFIAVIIPWVLLTHPADAQQILQGFETLEIQKISEVYRNAPDLSFSINYTYKDSAFPGTILEQMTGNYKIKDGNYWSIMDSIEYLQGNQYSVTVFHHDSTITVNEKVPYGNLLKVPVIDSLFRAGNADSMSVTTVNDSTRSFLVLFNQNSYYRKYELQYDPNTYWVKKIEYYLKEYTDTSSASGIAIITMTLSGYSESVVDPAVFNEGKFIYRQGDYFYLKPGYTTFKLLLNIPGASEPPL